MFQDILLALQIIVDIIRQKTIWQDLREQVYMDRVVVPVILDLNTQNDQHDPFQNSDYRFVELNLADLDAKKFTFSIINRYFKAILKIKRGLRGFALLKGNTVIGDIWCLAPRDQNAPFKYHGLNIPGMTFIKGDAFAADMYIDPAFRGKKLAVPIFRSMMMILSREGRHRLYASYYEDNISSRWMHWMLKFKELPKLRESRFFTIKTYRHNPTNPTI